MVGAVGARRLMSVTELQVQDPKVLTAWNKSFLGRIADPSLREELLSNAVYSTFSAGNILQSNESPWLVKSWPVCLVVDGVFREFVGSESGRQATVQYMRPGDVWGLVRVLSEKQVFDQHAQYQALAPSRVMALSREKFIRALETRPAVGLALARELARLLVIRTRIFEASVFTMTSTRVAQHIAQLAVENEDGIPTVWLSQQEIADAVGTVREVVTRIIGQFREQGIVRYAGRRLEILDVDALMEVGQLP
jgi:CRP/FNR family transcriptional regulator, cyclic AMP receptor protein